MMMVIWAYAGLIGAVAFSLAAAVLIIGMPIDAALMLGIRTAAWMLAIAAVIAIAVSELSACRSRPSSHR